ncbi:MAG: hypothetical protein ACI9K5_002403, partial [Gammaproteobacteria bacterium]
SLAICLGLAMGSLHAQGDGGGGSGAGGGGGAGGSYGGPGDTIPGGGNGGGGNGGGSGGGTTGRPFLPPGVTPPGSPYAPGANPLAPRPFLPGGPNDPTVPPAGPRSPGARPLTESPTSWQLWWHYNRWDYLQGTSVGVQPTTGTTGFFLGRGQAPQLPPTRRAGSSELRMVVQPALIEVLESNPNVQLAGHALMAFAKLRGVPSEEHGKSFNEVIDPLLRDGNQTISELAILCLGVRGNEDIFAGLAGVALDDEAGRKLLDRKRISLRQQFFAVAALGLLGDRTQNDALRMNIDAVLGRLILDREDRRPELKAMALIAMGHVPLPTDDQLATAEGLSAQSRSRVDQVLSVLAFFEHKNSHLLARSQAPRAAAMLVEGAPESLRLRVMTSFLAAIDPHSNERREVLGAAIQALGQIATSGSDPLDSAVRRQLESLAYGSGSSQMVRSMAIVALARSSSRPGPGEEPMLGYDVAKRLFLKRLGRSRGQTLAWTALGLGLLEANAAERGESAGSEVTDALRIVFKKTRNAEVLGATAVALGLVRDMEAQELLVTNMIESSHERVRGYSALALGMIGQTGAVQELRQHLQRSAQQPFALEQGAIALAILGDQDAAPVLLQILENANPTVQASIASAMGWIRDPRALQILTRRMTDPTRSSISRGWAAVAIGRIADQEDWPWVARYSTNIQYDVSLPELLDPVFEQGLLDLK